jgi:hypothetical protein
MALGVLALPVSPELKLTDLRLVDVFLPRKEPEEAQRLFREAEARTIGVAPKAVQLMAERDGMKDPQSFRGPPANRPPGPTCAKEPAGVVHKAAG